MGTGGTAEVLGINASTLRSRSDSLKGACRRCRVTLPLNRESGSLKTVADSLSQ
jgi:hypothetical protein